MKNRMAVVPLSSHRYGENAPLMHQNCRCSMASYSDRQEYDEWLEYFTNDRKTEEWEKLKKGKKAIVKVPKVV